MIGAIIGFVFGTLAIGGVFGILLYIKLNEGKRVVPFF
tara:strand:+ start:779 stop:892 length:114 start_codon:yes stop_codon:yes gene_type:complete